VLTGASKTLLPDGRGPHFEWVWGLYNFTHSAIVFCFCFGAFWLLVQKPVLEMLGWAIHIIVDVFTHGGMFAIKFLWPVSSVHVDGKRWETAWFLAANYTALASLYVWLYLRRFATQNDTAHRAFERRPRP
jgi:hypothetical protein